jgi:hypothetical protein
MQSAEAMRVCLIFRRQPAGERAESGCLASLGDGCRIDAFLVADLELA